MYFSYSNVRVNIINVFKMLPILHVSEILESYSSAIHVPLSTCIFEACLQNNLTSLSEIESDGLLNCRNNCSVRRHTASASDTACLW